MATSGRDTTQMQLIPCPACGATNRVPPEKLARGLSIPTLLVLKGGREIDRIVGVQPKAELVRRLERALA